MNYLLESILAIQTCTRETEAMQSFLLEQIPGAWQDPAGNIYASKGEGPWPCIVAHMDTVHRIEPGESLVPVEISGLVTGILYPSMQQGGIGGDDKCGIYAALRSWQSLDNVRVVFFVDEESGCNGSYASDAAFFRECRYVLQADRRGASDFVTDISGPLSSSAFLKAVKPLLKKHGFSQSPGGLTDVMALRDIGVGVSVANMSAGYYEPHSRGEYIDLTALENTVALMLAICRKLKKPFPFKPTAKKWPVLPRTKSRTPFKWEMPSWPDLDAVGECTACACQSKLDHDGLCSYCAPWAQI